MRVRHRPVSAQTAVGMGDVEVGGLVGGLEGYGAARVWAVVSARGYQLVRP